MNTVPLWQFSRPHMPAPGDKRTRLAAALLTAGLYALLAFFSWWYLNHGPVPAGIRDITATLLPDAPAKRVIEPLPPARLIEPRAEKPAPPAFTIAEGAPPKMPAPLPATTAQSPLSGGTSGNGTMGASGGGGGSGGCLDAVWMRAVTERVRQFFYYPPAALSVRKTGLVMVHFQLRRDGRIESLQISKSSGDKELDKAALDIMQKAQPLPPIPDRMHADRVVGNLPINFGVRSFDAGSTAGTCAN